MARSKEYVEVVRKEYEIRVGAYCDVLTRRKNEHQHTYALDFSDEVSFLSKEVLMESEGNQQAFVEEENVKFDSIYLGGGTPSALSPEHLDALLSIFSDKLKVDKSTSDNSATDKCSNYTSVDSKNHKLDNNKLDNNKLDNDLVNLKNIGEFTMEMNPETVTQERIDILKKHGVNRLSLGVQSSDNTILKEIGRKHSYEDVEAKLVLLQENGFSNISIDFISGFAGQTKRDVDGFVDLVRRRGLHHVSAYALTYSGTKLGVLEDEEERELFYYLKERLAELDFERYEISSFSQKGYESQHNSAYWNREEYIGLGPAAASFVRDGQKAYRMTNKANLNKYIEFYKNFDNYLKSEDSGLKSELSYTVENPENEVFDKLNQKSVSKEEKRSVMIENTDFSNQHQKQEIDKNKALFFDEIMDVEELEPFDEITEDLILPLRTSRGVCAEQYKEKHGIDLRELFSVKWLLENDFLVLVKSNVSFFSKFVSEKDRDVFSQSPSEEVTEFRQVQSLGDCLGKEEERTKRTPDFLSFLRFTDKGFDLSNSAYVKIIEEIEAIKLK